MKRSFAAAVLVISVVPLVASAQTPFTSLHPEAAYPDPEPPTSSGPYSDFIRRVQEKLLELGFAAGPANGDFGAKTQAALAQFQLSRVIPASGSLDDQTLAELGVTRERVEASAGATATPQGESPAGPPEASPVPPKPES